MKDSVSVGGVEVEAFASIDSLISEKIIIDGEVQANVAIAINPEKIMSAQSCKNIKRIIDTATLRYADGIGVSYVMSKKLKRKVVRIPGCELWERIMTLSVSHKTPVFLVGASENVISVAVEKLISKGVNVVGYQNGYFTKQQCPDVINNIKKSGATIITVAMGSPTQENFISECKIHIPNAFFMGVGGTYDVFTGNVKRAPYIFRVCRCEWLYRLLSQPTRIGRQFNLVKYIGLYLTKKL